nr:KICSTOR complex protein SZT2-like [Leptinotarsa decemlineata]
MEFDSQSQYSDEGVDLSISENGELYPKDYSFLEDSQPSFLEAKIVFLLMQRNVPVSRASRLQWLLDHLNTIVTPSQNLTETSNNLEVIAAIPREQNSNPKCNRYLVTYRTEVKFLAQSYRFVFCLDMSPSHANVDTEKGEILFDEILNCFKITVEALCREFRVPGNPFVFEPFIYLTVIVNTPFFLSPAQQVLVKGVRISQSNLKEIVKYVEKQFHLLEERIADVSAAALDQLDFQRTQNEGLVGDLFDLPESGKMYSRIPMVTPDVNFVNMLRYSMLAISLLPENSISHILVITDGVVAMPDSNIMESLLFQLHYDSIAISFLKVGSDFHPHVSSGFVAYTDLLYFFSHSTLGTCLENFISVENEPSKEMNIYQELFLFWSFHNDEKNACSKICDNKWSSSNVTFCSHTVPSLVSKRQTDENTTASFMLLLSRRMREGFTVDSIFFMNGSLEVKLILQWKTSIYIHYKVRTQWPVVKNLTNFEVFITAPYEFLHDITCILRKESKSLYRQAIIERFWMRLSQLSTGDLRLAQQMSSFPSNKDWYTLSESVRNGIPVYVLNNSSFTDATRLLLTPSNHSCLKFVNTWQPICQMESNNWRKWFHTQKVSLILQHDNLPKYLHLANSSQRFQVVQCRHSSTALYGLLADWASFILIENHTYLKFLYKESDKPPTWFCIIRISSKLPCIVLNIGFFTGTPGIIRHKVCNDLKSGIAALSYHQSNVKAKENACCMLLQKPLEKILIRYERIPNNYTTVIFPDGTQPPHSSVNVPPPVIGTLFTTLSRYLFHKRWIWSASLPGYSKLPDQSISRILNILTKMRIKEGFSFAHSASGIVTMVLELEMEPSATCVVQYVLFPPHWAYSCNDDEAYSGSDDDNEQSSENEAELQMITEVWIEPQYGKVVPSSPRISYTDDKHYYEIADVIYTVDLQCINALLTMEHLSLMCQEREDDNLSLNQVSQTTLTTCRKNCSRRDSRNSHLDSPSVAEKGCQWYPIVSPRIEHIPFNFDPINILPLCQQTELLFSMFIEGRGKSYSNNNQSDKPNRLLLDNILEHLGLLHDQELPLTKEESDRFTQEILKRHKNKHPHVCPISENALSRGISKESDEKTESQWRCFIKGVSVTHVILTFIVSTLDDLKALMTSNCTNIPNRNESEESMERVSSRGSNFSDVPINTTNSLCLPIYVFDCPLGRIVNAYVNKYEELPSSNEDIYEDHRFKSNLLLQEECVKIRGEANFDESEKSNQQSEPEQNSVKHHCRTVAVSHSKCFTVSLFVALHLGGYINSCDVQSVMDQCEETITEVDITEYITTICGHIKQSVSDKLPIKELNQASPCYDVKSLHMLIKENFSKLIGTIFNPIPTHDEFYFYKNLTNLDVDDLVPDSDDENSDNHSEVVEFRSEETSSFSDQAHVLHRMESGVSNMSYMTGFSGITNMNNNQISPLFLHLICTVRYNAGECSNTSIRVLPTCLGELIQSLENPTDYIDRSTLQVSLDMLCLTLPSDVQNIISDYSAQGLRTTSFSSDGFQPSISSEYSEASFMSQVSEPLKHLSESQKQSISSISSEIKWLLKDEICTALLDVDPVTSKTLNYVMDHVSTSSPDRTSCVLDVIHLNFVYPLQSHGKFVDEFSNLKLPYSGYKLCKKEDIYYLAKDRIETVLDRKEINSFSQTISVENSIDGSQLVNLSNELHNYAGSNVNDLCNSSEEMVTGEPSFRERGSLQSDISSINESGPGTDGGYDDDVSEDYDEYEWLITLNNKRAHLPNFWLIMKVSQDIVTIYFHCRFLELPTIQVRVYLEVQRAMRQAVKDLCKKVNQLLLLQTLYETKICDPLLEPDDNNDICNSPISRIPSFSRLKSFEYHDNVEDNDLFVCSPSLSTASLNFKVGEFTCPVVWETPFLLHPRLKTGPGKSGISRGILALKNILDKFSVSNRNNMFVYRNCQHNVFYLRLHENTHYSGNKSSIRTGDFESGSVSRSPSIASLPFYQNKSTLTQSEQSIISATSGDIRPRVRSFGERESNNFPNEDTLILKVHGITEAGSDVQNDLVQVLQNRLDDAVLEFLSVMLSRNAMCPLTPEDVHFIQKPFRPPEIIIRLTVQKFALRWLESFIHYLKQNLLQFLNVPKYTDSRSHFHFKDYVEEEANQFVFDENIFIYNQSQNPASGNRGIACIAVAFINNSDKNSPSPSEHSLFDNIFETEEFAASVTSEIIEGKYALLHINTNNNSAAVSQATWDIVMEYYLLKKSLCIQNLSVNRCSEQASPVRLDSSKMNFDNEIEFNCMLDTNSEKNIRESILNLEKPKLEIFRARKKRIRTIITPTPKTKRSITFDDDDKEKEPSKEKNHIPLLKPDRYECGESGILSVAYSKYLPNWLAFGHSLNTPSVKKIKINLNNRHLPHIIIAELMNILQDSPRSFRCIPTNPIKSESEDVYVPYIASNVVSKYVIISRNLEHWAATVSISNASEVPDFMSPHSLKHSQRFVPAVNNISFIPRQKILWVSVESDSIIMYAYNWAKDHIDKLNANCTNLGSWLCVRSCFLNSVISQKLGIFHNQPLTRKSLMIASNPYVSLIGNVDAMSSFPKDFSQKRVQPTYNLPGTLEAFRDNFRIHSGSMDPAVAFTFEIREIKSFEKRCREEMKTLHAMYQSRTSSVTVPQIYLLLQNSRIIHFCHTPLLFLPRWRLKSASTRDHSLYPSQAIQLADKMASQEKEMWHTELCYGFFSEYRHYMQTLGFMPLQIDNPPSTTGLLVRDKSSYNNVFYIQKTILGGILIFTVEFCEPFFHIKLLAIECSRLQNISSRSSINRFTLSFLDECDRVKILMHLHSFTYDYHLRCIFNYISNNSGVNKVCERYNVHQFLDDFMKYYNKAPNFAQNLVHTDTLTIKNLVTEGKQLYDYLLKNVDQYNFKVFEMDVHESESEFILVQVTSTSQVSYKDSQDRQHTDDFDITLVVYNHCMPYSPEDNVLHLRYYLILTSKREIYPKSEIDEKLGKFRTVSSTARSLSVVEMEPNEFEMSQEKSVGQDTQVLTSSGEFFNASGSYETCDNDESCTSQQSTSLPYVEINQESVNYLGYYSSHEQLMQQLILDKANTTQKHIKDMVEKGMVHCRTHLLWNRLISPHQSSALTYQEFLELKKFARLEHICHLYKSLGALLNQPLSWYQGLAKLLLVRYVDNHRTFMSPDGNIQHYVIMHQENFGAFMLLSVDFQTSRGGLYAVYREPQKQDMELTQSHQKSLLDGFVNFICFYLWSGMICN